MSEKQSTINYISPLHLEDEKIFQNQIALNLKSNYYWSDNWSKEFYIQLATKGFISTSYKHEDSLLLLPELQFSYSVLEFNNLHISKKVKKLIEKNEYIFSINTRFDEVLDAIEMQHKNSWITGKYRDVLKELYHSVNDNFNIVSVEITSDEELICGEIGYMIGKTYTSLSGFTSKDKRYNNYGTLQLVLLAKYLEKNNFFFWNLGHPYMEYKTKLGAKVLDRFDFLKKWNESISC